MAKRSRIHGEHGEVVDDQEVGAAVATECALELAMDLGDATLTAAILDRLAMHALRIDIDGPSFRQHIAHERAAGRGAKGTERDRPPRRPAGGA